MRMKVPRLVPGGFADAPDNRWPANFSSPTSPACSVPIYADLRAFAGGRGNPKGIERSDRFVPCHGLRFLSLGFGRLGFPPCASAPSSLRGSVPPSFRRLRPHGAKTL